MKTSQLLRQKPTTAARWELENRSLYHVPFKYGDEPNDTDFRFHLNRWSVADYTIYLFLIGIFYRSGDTGRATDKLPAPWAAGDQYVVARHALIIDAALWSVVYLVFRLLKTVDLLEADVFPLVYLGDVDGGEQASAMAVVLY